jgi:hypothetical protein
MRLRGRSANVIDSGFGTEAGPMSHGHKTEKQWETWLALKLQTWCGSQVSLSTIPVRTKKTSKTTECSMGYLCGGVAYSVFADTSDWNNNEIGKPYSGAILTEISGGMRPDIVLRSTVSDQNRIFIEIKESAKLNYTFYDSQIVRYFIHLLATSTSSKQRDTDLRRAILLAAPDHWFDEKQKVAPWDDFCDRFAGLADKMDITLGEIRLNDDLLIAEPVQ